MNGVRLQAAVAGEQPPPDGVRQLVGLCSRYVAVRPVSFYSYMGCVLKCLKIGYIVVARPFSINLSLLVASLSKVPQVC